MRTRSIADYLRVRAAYVLVVAAMFLSAFIFTPKLAVGILATI